MVVPSTIIFILSTEWGESEGVTDCKIFSDFGSSSLLEQWPSESSEIETEI